MGKTKYPEGGEFNWCAEILRGWGDVLDANHDYDSANYWFEVAEKIEKRKHTTGDLEAALLVLWQELSD